MTAEQLKNHRNQLGISQKELAIALCVTVRAVVAWETEYRNMPACCERLFCLIYNIPVIDCRRNTIADELTPELFQ